MFQNDMAFHIPVSNLTLYADDHQLYVTGKTYEEVESTLVTKGQQALLWYRNNFLSANPDKFQSLKIKPSFHMSGNPRRSGISQFPDHPRFAD